MEIVVQKFGGSSVADNNKLKKVCKRILEEYNNDKSVVVVVSAQGKTTDDLIEQEKTITKNASRREHDMLVTVGEQITIAKLSMMLQKKGYQAKSFLGWQVPIITNSNFSDADIEEVKTDKIISELKKGTIVIVAGFQGVDRNSEITTIGRGGSDTTAIALSIALKAEKCELFKDVDGIYSGDPHKDSKVIKYDKITYDEMLELSHNGAKVLHDKCIEMAKENLLQIIVKSTFKDNCPGTILAEN
jgi:aspartate kinase